MAGLPISHQLAHLLTMSQDRFFDCYRGRQGWLNHAAFLRLAKVFVTLEALDRNRISPRNKRLFDYGFGSGTLFRYLPNGTKISGVELSIDTVAEVSAMLQSRGIYDAELRKIDLDNWKEHPSLLQKYDIVICSHVLEHLEDPVEMLRILGKTLRPEGALVCIVPINELRANPHHVQKADTKKLRSWVAQSGLHLADLFEADPVGWPLQPLLASDHGFMHQLARITSLVVGLPFAIGGKTAWKGFQSIFGWIFPSSQACAVIRLSA